MHAYVSRKGWAWDGSLLSQNTETALRIQYDALDRPVSVHDERFGTARRVYDADGRTTGVVYPADPENGFPQGVVTGYQYDAQDRIVGIRDPQAGRWSFEYDASGRLVRRRDPAGLEREGVRGQGTFLLNCPTLVELVPRVG